MLRRSAGWGIFLATLGACTEFVSGGEEPTFAGGSGPDAEVGAAPEGGVPFHDAASRSDGEPADHQQPPPPVEILVSGLASVLAFSVDVDPAPRLVWLSSSAGVRTCRIGACESSQLVVSPDNDLVGPILAFAGEVYVGQRYRPVPLVPLVQERLLRFQLDGTGRQVRLETGELGALAADSTGGLVTHGRSVDDNVYRNELSWLPLDGGPVPPPVISQQTNQLRPPKLAHAAGRSAIAVYQGGQWLIRTVGPGGALTPLGLAEGVTALGLDESAVFASTPSAVVRCGGEGCAPILPAGDAGAFGPLAVSAQRLVVVQGSAAESFLLTCRLAGAALEACEPSAELGLRQIVDVQVAGGSWYVLGIETASSSDAAPTFGIRRLNLAP